MYPAFYCRPWRPRDPVPWANRPRRSGLVSLLALIVGVAGPCIADGVVHLVVTPRVINQALQPFTATVGVMVNQPPAFDGYEPTILRDAF